MCNKCDVTAGLIYYYCPFCKRNFPTISNIGITYDSLEDYTRSNIKNNLLQSKEDNLKEIR